MTKRADVSMRQSGSGAAVITLVSGMVAAILFSRVGVVRAEQMLLKNGTTTLCAVVDRQKGECLPCGNEPPLTIAGGTVSDTSETCGHPEHPRPSSTGNHPAGARTAASAPVNHAGADDGDEPLEPHARETPDGESPASESLER